MTATQLAEVSGEEALARIERVLEQVGIGHAAVATDGDGTLWTHDVGEALFEALLRAGLVTEPAREALLAEATGHGVDVPARATAAEIAEALFRAYVARRFPEDRMCAAMSWCMAGMSQDALATFSTDLLEHTFGLRSRLIPESIRVLRAMGERGLPVWLVSASPRAVVEAAAAIVADETGVAVPRVIAMTPRIVDGFVTPETDGRWPYGEGKRLALESVLGGRVLAVAMGDNVFDVAMLGAARVPLAIRPKPALVNAAAQVPGLMRLRSH